MSDDVAGPDGAGVSEGLSLLRRALTALENFDRFRRMMEDGPDASDKLLAEDYAAMAFVQGAQLIPLLRLQTKVELGARLYSEAEAVAAAHAAGFAGTHWSMGPEELAHLLNMVRARPNFGAKAHQRLTEE